MRLLVVAVGTRMPSWVAEAFADYAGRTPKTSRMSLIEVKAEPRNSGKSVPQLLAAEAARINDAVPEEAERIVLDERGKEFTTEQLARWLQGKLGDGRDLAFILGGPDGLAPAMKAGTGLQLRLSSMTLPHGLARVLLAEQLYRALSILQNHPYHRE